MKILFSFVIFFSILSLGLILSRGSIPNQEGYFELSWKINHLDFNTINNPAITPIIFLVTFFIERTLHISLANAWKVMDLVFFGFTCILFANIYWMNQKSAKFFSTIIPIVILCSLLNYIYSFTSMSGEGIPIFFAIAGLCFWQKHRFIPGVLLFIVSYLSKYTLFLIAPAIIIWTIFNFKNYTKKEIKNLVISGFIFILIFFIYNSLKNWSDFKLHIPYLSSFSAGNYIQNFRLYFISVLLGTPLIIIFSIFFPSWTNLFWLCGLSSLLMLSKRYFYWNHPQQIISMFMLYFFSSTKVYKFTKYKYLILQSIFCIGCFTLIPINSGSAPLFYKHMTINESKLIDEEIKKDYHGGKIGYYLNRRFDEPFPNYEISYMDPAWDFVIEDTEYVVVPGGGLPQQMVNFTQCQYIFYRQVGQNSIFKVACQKKTSA